DRSDKIYAMALKKGLRSPFEPPDELHPAKTEAEKKTEKPDEKSGDKTAESTAKPSEKPSEKPKVENVDIDLDGIAARIQEVPVPAGNYRDLRVAGERLCWIDDHPEDRQKTALECVPIGNKGEKPETRLEGVRGFELSADGKKMMIHKQNDVYVMDSSASADALKNPKTLSDAHVDLSGWKFSVIPVQEFSEAYLDAWRLERDYFYDPGMHHVPWTTIRDKYSELVNRVRDRYELSDLISEMVSELSALHTFVNGGDLRHGSDQIPIGSLGALLTRDESAGGYRVEHIYQSDPDRPDKISPLLQPGAG